MKIKFSRNQLREKEYQQRGGRKYKKGQKGLYTVTFNSYGQNIFNCTGCYGSRQLCKIKINVRNTSSVW